ncbi:MAG: tRNA threonylcarbamoyladenosine dehydratase [Lachnospiraceae bacterium]|nr:tRNA threonylcarbamoyladenosine dehydratase [Lachnospiraceae bacterium]
MKEIYERTAMLIGEAAIDKLSKSHVAVFGVGGVGGHATEALARAGIGEITVIDRDIVSASNLNRQLIALNSTVGLKKTSVIAARLRDINPDIIIHERAEFFLPNNSDSYDFTEFDYVCDCVDNVTAKLELIRKCREAGTPVISAMGTGRKLYPDRFRVMDVFETKNCPLARIMRKELKKRNIDKLTVVASDELPVEGEGEQGRTPGSVSFVPSVAGLIMAGHVVRELISYKS